MKITYAGHEFILHPSGALFWPDEKILVVSDLHLEKASHFAKKGFFLPPYDSRDTLSQLIKTCTDTQCSRIILLGDIFHDEHGYARMEDKDRAAFNFLLSFSPVWIKGNHDKDFVPEGFCGAKSYMHHGVVFRHETANENEFEISGHFHPKVEITRAVSRPCFIEDGKKMILPSFGSYTGGLSVSSAPIMDLFLGPPRIYAAGQNKVYLVSMPHAATES